MKKNQSTGLLRTYLKNGYILFVIKNLLIALGVIIVAITIVLLWLKRYTEHGQEFAVPDVTRMYVEEARPILEAQGMRLVVIDSTYSKKVPYGTIVEQNPPTGRMAKHGRNVYLIINANGARQVALPDLYDVSYRQAEATLLAMNIKVEEVLYEPSEFKDIVLDVLYKGTSLSVGSRLTEGCSVTLVIGQGRGTEMVEVPNLIGMTVHEARSLLLAQYLTLGVIDYDEPPTEETQDSYVIYNQTPNAGEMLLEGSGIDVHLSTNVEKAAVAVEQESNDDDFF